MMMFQVSRHCTDDSPDAYDDIENTIDNSYSGSEDDFDDF